jgi:hypothetical protein
VAHGRPGFSERDLGRNWIVEGFQLFKLGGGGRIRVPTKSYKRSGIVERESFY